LVTGNEWFESGLTTKRIGADLDEVLESAIGNEVFGWEELHGGRAGVVAVVEPALDVEAVVGEFGAEVHRGFHDVEGDRALEKARNAYA